MSLLAMMSPRMSLVEEPSIILEKNVFSKFRPILIVYDAVSHFYTV